MDGVDPAEPARSPAADDNGSGTVDILEVARILSNHPFDRTLVLLFSTGEEQGALGVQSYLNQLSPQEISAIKYVVDIDMVGYDSNSDGAMQLWSGSVTDSPSLTFAQMFSEVINSFHINLTPNIVTGCT
jgi:Zn-dependent M28 family amino/carboxypeptidase